MIGKLVKYVIADILRSKIIVGYIGLMLVLSFSVFSMEDQSSKGLLSMLNVTLVIVPLVSVVFSAIYMYNSSEFVELLVSQPIERKTIWSSLFSGVGGSLVIAYLIGVGVPILIFAANLTGLFLVSVGLILSIAFAGLGMMATVKIRDKARGIGMAIMMWLYFALIFDGIVLFLSFQLADYPLEKPMVIISALNPIDLARILVLLHMDVSVLMGYTGAVFTAYFGTLLGMGISFFILFIWCFLPYRLGQRWFVQKDL